MGKEEISVFVVDITVYVENSKELTPKLLGWISNYINIAGYKINIYEFIAFLYTSNEQVEFKIKNNIFTLVLSKMKYLCINLMRLCTTPIWRKLQNCDERNQRRT